MGGKMRRRDVSGLRAAAGVRNSGTKQKRQAQARANNVRAKPHAQVHTTTARPCPMHAPDAHLNTSSSRSSPQRMWQKEDFI